MLCDEFTKGKKKSFQREELHKKFNRNWWIIRKWELMGYTR